MRPILFTIGDLLVPSYGVIYLAAFVAAVVVFARLAARVTDLSFEPLFQIGVLVAMAGEIGARIAFVIVERDAFTSGAITLRDFLVGGRVVLGGVVAGALMAVYLFRRHRLPVGETLDAAFVGTALGMAIGRIGCFMAGCCYGKPTAWWWGVTFTDPMAQRLNGTPLGVSVHPTQLIQSLTAFAIFGVLLRVQRRPHRPGQISALFLILVGSLRFLNELLRGDPRGMAAGISTSQWIGLAVAAAGALSLAWLARRPPPARSTTG